MPRLTPSIGNYTPSTLGSGTTQVAVPSGTKGILAMLIFWDSQGADYTPAESGWSQLGATQRNATADCGFKLYWRPMPASPPASYGFTKSGGGSGTAAWLIHIPNADTVNPFGSAYAYVNDNSEPITASAVTTTEPNSLLIAGAMVGNTASGSDNFTLDDGSYAKFVETNNSWVQAALAHKTQAAAGLSGTPGFTNSATNGGGIAVQVAVRGAEDTDPPDAPVLKDAKPGDQQVALSWQAPLAGAAVTGYKVRWGTAPGSHPNTLDVGNATGHTVTGLTNGTAYFFAVVAYNLNGDGPPSNERSATPQGGHSRLDGYADAQSALVGTTSPEGALRYGADVETPKTVASDHGKARFKNLAAEGWARQALAYDYPAVKAGRTLAARLDIGDIQASQPLAFGFFPSQALDPHNQGAGLIFDGAGTLTGAVGLNDRTGGYTPLFEGLTKVEMLLLGVMSVPEHRVMFLGSSAEGAGGGDLAKGLGGYPKARVWGRHRTPPPAPGYAGFQSRLGRSSRVAETRVADVAAWGEWYGAALVADRGRGGGGAAGTAAEAGGTWSALVGSVGRSVNGFVSGGSDEHAIALTPAEAQRWWGLEVKTGATVNETRLMFCGSDASNYLQVRLNDTLVALDEVVAGNATNLDQTGAVALAPNSTYYVQVRRDGDKVTLWVNDTVALSHVLTANLFTGGKLLGLAFGGAGNNTVSYLEAWPEHVTIPAAADPGAPYQRRGSLVVASDDFTGPAGPLAGRNTPVGGRTWQASLASNAGERFELTGNGTVVQGPTRLGVVVASIPWTRADFADLEVTVIPKGSGYGNGDALRAGVVFWQDAANWLYLRLFQDDSQPGSSEVEVVTYRLGADEVSLYCNLGTRLQHGVAATLRATFNGDEFIVYVNGEPVVHRAWTDFFPSDSPLVINRVGIANDYPDTGAEFTSFVARDEDIPTFAFAFAGR